MVSNFDEGAAMIFFTAALHEVFTDGDLFEQGFDWGWCVPFWLHSAVVIQEVDNIDTSIGAPDVIEEGKYSKFGIYTV